MAGSGEEWFLLWIIFFLILGLTKKAPLGFMFLFFWGFSRVFFFLILGHTKKFFFWFLCFIFWGAPLQ